MCFTVEVTGVPENSKLTGTNCNFAINAYVQNDPAIQSAEPWSTARVKSIELTIAGQPVNLLAPGENVWTYNKIVRFASNHFAHDTVLDIKFKAEFVMTAGEASTTRWGEVTISPRAHNVALVTRTTVNVHGNPSPEPLSFPTVAELGATDAISKFTAAKHAVSAGTTHTESQFLTALGPATAVFVFSHGYVDGITSADNLEFISWADMASNPLPSNIVPGRSLAFFYSCSTNPNSYNAVSALGMGAPPNQRPKTAVVGFTFPLWSAHKPGDNSMQILQTEANDPISMHSQALLNKLCQGTAVGTAIEDVDLLHPCRTPVGAAETPTHLALMPTTRSGDPAARLCKVYLGGNVTPEIASDWYLILPANPVGGGVR